MKKIQKFGLWSALALLALTGGTAFAHVNIHGDAFHNFNAREEVDIDYLGIGVRNLSTASQRFVVAAVPYIQSTSPNATVTFRIDGKNATGTTTGFTLSAYESGLLRSSVSFTTGPGAGQVGAYTTDQVLTNLNQFCRVSLLALLPANSSSVIYGVTQIQ